MRELSNYQADPTDEGTIWFSDSDAEEKILAYLNNLSENGYLIKDSKDAKGKVASKFLDLGCGNGHLLFALRDSDWNGYMVGVDYSEESVKLARCIAASRAAGDEDDTLDKASNLSAGSLAFVTHDILDSSRDKPDWFQNGFDCLLDKGTFDAVSLSTAQDVEGRHGSDIYALRVQSFIRPSGFLVVTSCNWTEDELCAWFVTPQTELNFFGRIKYPSFQFGGSSGQSIVTICFQKSES